MTESPWKRTAGRGRDNPRPDLRVLLASDLDFPIRHRFADFPLYDQVLEAVEEAARAVEDASNSVEGDIGIPLLVRPERHL